MAGPLGNFGERLSPAGFFLVTGVIGDCYNLTEVRLKSVVAQFTARSERDVNVATSLLSEIAAFRLRSGAN